MKSLYGQDSNSFLIKYQSCHQYGQRVYNLISMPLLPMNVNLPMVRLNVRVWQRR